MRAPRPEPRRRGNRVGDNGMANIIRAASRRDVLKIAGLGTRCRIAGAARRPGGGQVAQLHAREFVHPHLRRVLQEHAGAGIPEGHRHRRRLPVDQRRQPADPHGHRRRDRQRPRHDIDILQLAVPVRREAGRCQRHRRGHRQEERRLVQVRRGSGGRQRQVEGDPVRQCRPDHELAQRLVRRSRASRTSPTPGTSCWRPAPS